MYHETNKVKLSVISPLLEGKSDKLTVKNGLAQLKNILEQILDSPRTDRPLNIGASATLSDLWSLSAS